MPLIEDGNSSDINCFDSHQNATQLMNSISNRITERSNRFNAQVDHISHKFGHLSLNGNSQSQPMLGSSQSAETPRKLLPLKRVWLLEKWAFTKCHVNMNNLKLLLLILFIYCYNKCTLYSEKSQKKSWINITLFVMYKEYSEGKGRLHWSILPEQVD